MEMINGSLNDQKELIWFNYKPLLTDIKRIE